MMMEVCHRHPVWSSSFVRCLREGRKAETERFELAATWLVNMVVGSYCFPRYVAALAARAEPDAVRHGLLENAWDESGGHAHERRSHFWLAVKLARLLGLTDLEIDSIEALPEARMYADEHLRACVSGPFGFGLGMVSLIEEFTTPEFTILLEAFMRSCSAGVGIERVEFVVKGGAEYFGANIADDERHREEMPRIAATWLEGQDVNIHDRAAIEGGLAVVRKGCERSVDLRSRFFDGIYEFVVRGGTHRDLVRSGGR
jgi:pyrroloquinoline quinone (PQQ) biosynthesis protein C